MDITVTNLTKIYGQQKAVDDISFQVKTGEILGFLGPNGAGKTTTMRAITSCIFPTTGKISIGNLDVFEDTEEVKKFIGYLPENNPLYQDMYVIDYLKFVSGMRNIPENETENRILEMVHVCGLQTEKHKKIQELSKGFKQRVGLAQALIHNPPVLILDEPTSGLDPNQIIEIRELIKRIGKAKTIILSSHILAEVEATCDRIMIINKGRLVADGTPEQLRKRSRGDELLKIKIEDGENNIIFNSLKQLPGVTHVDPQDEYFVLHSEDGKTLSRSVFKLCVDNSWILTEMTPVHTKLEDVFRELTMN